jgi:hypothetical protein
METYIWTNTYTCIDNRSYPQLLTIGKTYPGREFKWFDEMWLAIEADNGVHHDFLLSRFEKV